MAEDSAKDPAADQAQGPTLTTEPKAAAPKKRGGNGGKKPATADEAADQAQGQGGDQGQQQKDEGGDKTDEGSDQGEGAEGDGKGGDAPPGGDADTEQGPAGDDADADAEPAGDDAAAAEAEPVAQAEELVAEPVKDPNAEPDYNARTLIDIVGRGLKAPTLSHDDRLRLHGIETRLTELKAHLRQLDLSSTPKLHALLKQVEASI